MEFRAIEPGRVAMPLAPAEFLYNPLGSVHGGRQMAVAEGARRMLPAGSMPPPAPLACCSTPGRRHERHARGAGTQPAHADAAARPNRADARRAGVRHDAVRCGRDLAPALPL
jgi:hypothetical protein